MAQSTSAQRGDPPALTLDNVVKVLNGGSVKWTQSLCVYGFRIPRSKYYEIENSSLTSEEKWKASIDYMLSVDPTPSWRRIISAVDFWDQQYSAASRLYQYAEPVMDPTLTPENVRIVLEQVDGIISVYIYLRVPGNKRGDIMTASDYFVSCGLHPTWMRLAGVLYLREEERALTVVRRFLHTPSPDPSLTVENMCEVLKGVDLCVCHWQFEIPNIFGFESNTAMCKEYLDAHPAPSWAHIAEGLFQSKKHDVLKQLERQHPIVSSISTVQDMPDDSEILCEDEKYPGIVVTKGQQVVEKISSARKEINHDDIGISIVIPENSVSPHESVDLEIQPCLNGSFEIPKELKPVSPAYLIKTNKDIELKKALLVKIQHYANLQTEEDLVFLRANSDPEYRGSNPVYVFREVEGIRGTFSGQVGEIELRSFSLLRIFQRRKIKGQTRYSARLYKAVSAGSEVTAVFCMCPDHKFYTKHCDKLIPKQYSGMTDKDEGRIVYKLVTIISDRVSLKAVSSNVMMDKSEIWKEEIDFPEENCRSASRMTDYPPRITVTCTKPGSEPLMLHVEGLRENYTFNMLPKKHHMLSRVNTQPLQSAKKSLEKQLIKTKNSPVLVSVRTMMELMNEVEALVHDRSSIGLLVDKVEKVQELTDFIIKSTESMKKEVTVIPKVVSASQQLKIGAMAKLKYCTGEDDWLIAIDILVTNAAELMNCIEQLLTELEHLTECGNTSKCKISSSVTHQSAKKPGRKSAANCPALGKKISEPRMMLLRWTASSGQSQVLRLQQEMSPKWRDIGQLLCISGAQLDGWEEMYQRDPIRCIDRVVQTWMQRSSEQYPIKWEGLLKLLDDVQLNSIADQLEEAALVGANL